MACALEMFYIEGYLCAFNRCLGVSGEEGILCYSDSFHVYVQCIRFCKLLVRQMVLFLVGFVSQYERCVQF